MDIDCTSGLFTSGEQAVPTVTVGVPIIHSGDVEIRFHAADQRLYPGDILVDPVSHHQVPIRSVHADRFDLAWPWTGPETDGALISQGVLVRLAGERVSFSRSVCQVYDVGASRWKKGRDVPVTVIRTPGFDLEDGFTTRNFEHPGDYHHANVSLSSGGGTNGVRYTGGVRQSHAVVSEHGRMLQDGYPPEGIGAGFLLLANTVQIQPRQLMNAASRCFIMVGGHRVELEGICEGPLQMVWAPGGAASLSLAGAMNHQNSTAPRDLPWIDLGERRGANRTSADITFPFIFFQWGRTPDREVLIRAKGDPVRLSVRGSVKNLAAVADVPDGSMLDLHVACLDKPNYECTTEEP
jgi:hypothetical protein